MQLFLETGVVQRVFLMSGTIIRNGARNVLLMSLDDDGEMVDCLPAGSRLNYSRLLASLPASHSVSCLGRREHLGEPYQVMVFSWTSSAGDGRWSPPMPL